VAAVPYASQTLDPAIIPAWAVRRGEITRVPSRQIGVVEISRPLGPLDPGMGRSTVGKGRRAYNAPRMASRCSLYQARHCSSAASPRMAAAVSASSIPLITSTSPGMYLSRNIVPKSAR